MSIVHNFKMIVLPKCMILDYSTDYTVADVDYSEEEEEEQDEDDESIDDGLLDEVNS